MAKRGGSAWRRVAGLVVALLFVGSSLAGEVPLRGEWRPAGAEADAWQPFEPARLTRIARNPDGALVRLWPAAADGSRETADDLLLVVRRPGLERLAWHPAEGVPVAAHLLQTSREGWIGHGRIGFPLDSAPRPGEPLLLRLQPQAGINGTLAFALQRQTEFLAEDARWLALVATCLAILLGMALMALVFTVRLRDATFLYYAAYLLSYAMIQGIQTGFVASPLGWSAVAEAPRDWGRVAVVGSVVMSVLFLVRFASLPAYLPRATRLLLGYAALVALNAAIGLWPHPAAAALSSALVNPLLILGGPLLLVVSLHAWWRGSRYAGFFAVGWTPLLLLTVAGSLQLYGYWPDWLWSEEATLVAAAFEALVLSAGLADRTAAMRRDRDAARAMADIDALTGVLNRRALQRRFDESGGQRRGPTSQSVLFCDIDHFKRLNDSLGHAVGDDALRAVASELRRELRSRDSIGRYGGEEFVLLLPDCDLEAAMAIAERLRTGVEELGRPPRFGEHPLTISIGVAARAPGEAIEATVQRADAAMYEAKRTGRNRVCGEADGAR
jgi:diguanylate cyclase (GGDEF)-like protein